MIQGLPFALQIDQKDCALPDPARRDHPLPSPRRQRPELGKDRGARARAKPVAPTLSRLLALGPTRQVLDQALHLRLGADLAPRPAAAPAATAESEWSGALRRVMPALTFPWFHARSHAWQRRRFLSSWTPARSCGRRSFHGQCPAFSPGERSPGRKLPLSARLNPLAPPIQQIELPVKKGWVRPSSDARRGRSPSEEGTAL